MNRPKSVVLRGLRLHLCKAMDDKEFAALLPLWILSHVV